MVLKRGVPSEKALLAFDRAVDATIGATGTEDVPVDCSTSNWAPLLELARRLRAEGLRSRSREDSAAVSRIMDDVWGTLGKRPLAPSRPPWRRLALPTGAPSRFGFSAVAGLCLGVLTITVTRSGAIPLYVAGAPSFGLTLTAIGYGLSGRTVEFQRGSVVWSRRR